LPLDWQLMGKKMTGGGWLGTRGRGGGRGREGKGVGAPLWTGGPLVWGGRG